MLATTSLFYAQNTPQNAKPKLKSPGKILTFQPTLESQNTPTIEPVFQETHAYKSLPELSKVSNKFPKGFKILTSTEGVPTMISGEVPIEGSVRNLPLTARCQQYLEAVKSMMSIKDPVEEFEVKSTETDEMGHTHVRMQQKFGNLPVWGSEIILHERGGKLNLLNGSYYPTPSVLSLEPTVSMASATDAVKADLEKIKPFSDLNDAQLKQVGGKQMREELVIFHVNDKKDAERLAYHVTIYANVIHRWEYFIDAQNGQVLDKYESSCDFFGHYHNGEENDSQSHATPSLSNSYVKKEEVNIPLAPPVFDGKTTANTTDLLGQPRVINTYQVGANYFLIDASRTMFSPTQSVFPNDPVGAIQTFDNRGSDGGGSAYFITSGSNTWADRKAVSAHYNAGRAYDYFKTTFLRNSINNKGGNISSFINVKEDGAEMDNAYWNGEAMFYGNGAQAFSPLPAALDVAGHEISHGVVQSTANLKYQGESGAMNESFADIFGAMIDRDDWKMGEDVVKLAFFPSGALRDLSNPNNGTTQGKNGWQPKFFSERYTGTQDNGGVHINSGIPNYAFYLFATTSGMTKDIAERVFYHALSNYLVASSKFIDLRAAVEQSCKTLYPSQTAVLTAAQNAFTTVGIGGGGSTTGSDYQKDIPTNPGQDWIIGVSQEAGTTPTKLLLYQVGSTSSRVLFSNGVKTRPSITDNGSRVVFVGTDTKIYSVSITWANGTPTPSAAVLLSQDVDWNNIAISKDGTKVAANAGDSILYVFNLTAGTSKLFRLYNPTTTSNGVKTYDVRYSDALEWDNTGENVMYDALTSTPRQGDNLEYWDIGFINVWSNTTRGFAAGNIEKLFSGLPENTDIGNPTFAKNSPHIVAFDYLEKDPTTGDYDGFYLIGVNTQTGAVTDSSIFSNTTIGVPSYSRTDDKLLFTYLASGTYSLASIGLVRDKIHPVKNAQGAFVLQKAQKGNWFSNGTRSTSSVKEELDNNSVLISPNPFKDNLTLEIQAEKAGVGKVEIFDLVGKTVSTHPLSISSGKNPISINTQPLQAGAYLLRVTIEGKYLTKKIIKF